MCCKDCSNRFVGCHKICEAYLLQSLEGNIKKNIERSARASDTLSRVDSRRQHRRQNLFSTHKGR